MGFRRTVYRLNSWRAEQTFYRYCDRCGINQIANFFTSVRQSRLQNHWPRATLTQRNATRRSGGLRCRCAWSRFIGVAHPGVNGRYYALEITLVSRARRRIVFVFAKPSNREQSIRGSVKLWASSRRRFIHPEDLYFKKSLDNERASHCVTVVYISFFRHVGYVNWDKCTECI